MSSSQLDLSLRCTLFVIIFNVYIRFMLWHTNAPNWIQINWSAKSSLFSYVKWASVNRIYFQIGYRVNWIWSGTMWTKDRFHNIKLICTSKQDCHSFKWKRKKKCKKDSYCTFYAMHNPMNSEQALNIQTSLR